jgi:predicted transcriptional regulator
MATTLRLPESIDARLSEMATSTGKSRNQLIIEILGDAFKIDDAIVEADAIFDKIADRDRNLLSRLADA